MVGIENLGADREEHGIAEWSVFENRLAAYLSTMNDPSDTDRLVLFVPVADSETPVRRIEISSVNQGRGLWIEYPFDEVGEDLDDLLNSAQRLGDTIRFRDQVGHPGLMTALAEGPAASGFPILGLANAATVEAESLLARSGASVQEVVWVTEREELLAVVHHHLAVWFGSAGDVVIDEDDGLVVQVTGAWSCLAGDADKPFIDLWTPAVVDVRSGRQADVELNVLNRQQRWTRWVRNGEVIVQRASIACHPFNPVLFRDVLDEYLAAYRDGVCDLADRVGGEVAPGPPDPNSPKTIAASPNGG